jgi:peptide/nickel transport system substrate-binding protein
MSSRWLFLCLMALLAACAAPAAGPPTAVPLAAPTAEPTPAARGAGDTLQLLYWQAPTILNPHLSAVFVDWEASRITYEPLASFDKDGQLVTFLAAEVPSLENGGVASDGRSVTWKLKPGLMWSDGEEMTADDVVFTYEYVTNPEVGSASKGFYDSIASVVASDRYTVKISFKDVTPAWAVPFVGSRGVILPRHIFSDYNNAEAKNAPANNQPVGTGPYRVLEFKPQEVLFLGNRIVETNKVVYEVNPFFREADKPYFRRVELRGGGSADEAARFALQTGGVDYAWNLQVPGALLDELATDGKGRVFANFGARVERLVINHSDPNRETADGERSFKDNPHPFLSDQRVREALTLAINRTRIVEEIYGTTASLSSNLLVSPANYNSTNTGASYDPAQAAALLDAAGWRDSDGDGLRDKDGRPMSMLILSTNNTARQQMLAIIKENLEALGIEIRLELLDPSIITRRDPANQSSGWHFYADMQVLFYGNSIPDPGAYMQEWTCGRIPQKANDWTAGFNLERFCDPAYDQLYSQSRTEIDPAARQQLFIEMNDLLIDEAVSIPLFISASISGASLTLEGLNLTPWDADVWNIMDWRRVS